MRFLAIIIISILAGCSSLEVKRLDPSAQPKGLPFYLNKNAVKVTEITYEFYKISDKKVIKTIKTQERELITLIDSSVGYTLNHTRPFAGESKFKVVRSNGSDVSTVEAENKEGVTEFLKGLVEGAKTLTELAREAKDAAAPAGAITDAESVYFTQLAQQDIVVFKTIDNIYFEEVRVHSGQAQ